MPPRRGQGRKQRARSGSRPRRATCPRVRRMSALVSLRGVSKSFAGVRVLKDVDFDVQPGEVHALLGENGAGKSTLIKIVAGVHVPDGGTITIGDRELSSVTPRDAVEGGIATVYQELLLFPELSVAENVFLGHAPTKGFGRLDWTQMRRRSRQILDSLDSHDLDVDAKVGTLSVANRQRVEIAKALSQNARVLIMDEPTAALADADVRRLMDVVRRLRDRGVGIVYVTHKLPEIFELADRVTVLRDGALIGTRPIAEVTEQSLVAMMVGREIDHLFPKPDAQHRRDHPQGHAASPAATASATSPSSSAAARSSASPASSAPAAPRLALTIFGIDPGHRRRRSSSRAAASPSTSPRQACDLGIAYVPEDRGLQGLVRPMTIAQNISMASLDKVASGIFIRTADEALDADASIRQLGTRARGPDQVVGQLSGGNQQKVVLGKWLADEPADPHPRRADPRHRRRRQGRDLRPDGPPRPGGHGHPDDLLRPPRSPRHERPRPRHARRPPRRHHRPRRRQPRIRRRRHGRRRQRRRPPDGRRSRPRLPPPAQLPRALRLRLRPGDRHRLRHRRALRRRLGASTRAFSAPTTSTPSSPATPTSPSPPSACR